MVLILPHHLRPGQQVAQAKPTSPGQQVAQAYYRAGTKVLAGMIEAELLETYLAAANCQKNEDFSRLLCDPPTPEASDDEIYMD